MRNINYKSDFDFLLSLTDSGGSQLGFPEYDWELRVYIRPNTSNVLVASQRDGELTNCFNDNGKIHVVCDGHGFGKGMLYGEFRADIPNAIYADGRQLTVTPFLLGIRLVDARSDDGGDIEVANTLPMVFVTAYELAVKQGYTGTEEEYMEATIGLVDTVEAAKATLEQSQQAALDASEAARKALETAEGSETVLGECRLATGNAGDAAESAHNAAEQARIAAESADNAAEAARTAATSANNAAESANNAAESFLSGFDTVTMEVTYEDESVEEFEILVKKSGNGGASNGGE